MSETWNRATLVFEFAPDKWMGLEDFQQDVMLLRRLANRLGMSEGPRSAGCTIERVGPIGEADE